MEEKVLKETKNKINEVLESEITPSNLDHLYKLVDIYKDIKEVECMNYGNYNGYGNYSGYGNYGNYSGRGPSRGSYGEYGNYGEYGRDSYGNEYGRRGYDKKYRGHDHIDRMANEYGRYMESRERYGAGEESDKAFHFMTKALEEYIDFLHEEAETPSQKQMLNETLQRSMR